MFAACTTSDVDSVIDASVSQFLTAAKVSRPPVDAVAVADWLGFALVWDDRQSGRARIAMAGGRRGRMSRPTIFLRPDPRPERVQWAVAHELGESAIESLLLELRVKVNDLKEQTREQLANRFASRLLLPSNWFADSARDAALDLFALKQVYVTASHELIGWRMLDLAAPAIVSLFDQGRLQSRRSNLPGKIPPLCESEIDTWRRSHQTGKAALCDIPHKITAWPVHEPDWKREIVRLDIAEWDD